MTKKLDWSEEDLPIENAQLRAGHSTSFTGITIGEVIDTNDPQQMGRVRAFCTAFGDNANTEVQDIPWSSYISPFGGSAISLPRGPEAETTEGSVHYGFWGVPKVGSFVLVACIDGDPRFRVWMGCMQSQFKTHTMPHGRYSYARPNEGTPEGPMSSIDQPIEPLNTNQNLAFGSQTQNFERRTRSVDNTVSAVRPDLSNETNSVSDDLGVPFTEEDGNELVSLQGYAESQLESDYGDETTDGLNYDPQTYSWTTPGFHSMSMDDRPGNCRMRLRTTCGHQILLDDTNERIYISTSEGKSWIEFDQNGNIDIHSDRRISVHAKKDINFSTDETFRVNAKQGIHLYSGKEIRVNAQEDIHIKSPTNLFVEFTQEVNIISHNSLFINCDVDIDIKALNNVLLSSSNNMDLYAGNVWKQFSSSTMNILSDAKILQKGTEIHLNSEEPTQAEQAKDGTPAKDSYWTNRIPTHEPWGRIMMDQANTDNDSGNSHVLQLSYTDSQVGKLELNDLIIRGPLWHR